MRTQFQWLAPVLMMAAAPVWSGGADPGMMAKLQGLYPKTQFVRVSTTDIPGISEVVMGKNVAYVDDTGRYFLFGRLYDMQTQQDLTAPKVEASATVDVTALPKELAIKSVRGNGQRELHVFTDPDCPYCRQLEKAMTKLTNATIYTYLMPLESLHPQAKSKAEAVWCAEDPLHAWQEMMLMEKDPPKTKADCRAPINEILALANQLGINGTPTMISGDGRKISGARDAASLDKWLGVPAGSSTAAASK